MAAKPFLKWAGGKSQILSKIRAEYPPELGKTIKKYAEPFVGGGAVLFDVLNGYNLDEVYIGDINRELIHTYITIRDNPNELIDNLKRLETEYITVGQQAQKHIYYFNRKYFNKIKAAVNETIELAALFIFLNKTCFNGLYRVNSKGEFNVPQGSYKNPKICDEENLRAVSEKLRGVRIVCGDYMESRSFIDNKTFVYFDPPYRPLTETAGFTAYTNDEFGDNEQTELARFIDEMSNRGAFVLASNSDPKNFNESDDFFDKLYEKHRISRIKANRAINSVGSGRGQISELLIASV